MGRSRIAWAAATFAPWALGFGLLVSITAHADPDLDMRGLTLPAHTLAAGFPGAAKLIEANYVVGDAEDLAALPDEIEPRYAPKRVRVASPVVNRADKGDPFIVLRPGFEAKAHAKGADLSAEPMSPPVRVALGEAATPARRSA
jgi:hypothetical protein